ncbi:MAG: HigA family addiction module antitoxin [Methylobacter sp.]
MLEEFLKPMQISQNELARSICVYPRRINEIIQGKRSITANTAIRLGRYFGVSAKFWLGLQDDYDLEESESGNRPYPAAKAPFPAPNAPNRPGRAHRISGKSGVKWP